MGEILWGKTPWGETLWGRTPWGKTSWGKTSERGPPLKGGPSLRTSLPRELSPQPPAFQSVRIRNRRTAGRLRGNSHPGERHMTKRQTAKLRFPARHGKAKAEKPKNRKNVRAPPRRRKTESDKRNTLINTKIRPAPNGAFPGTGSLPDGFQHPSAKTGACAGKVLGGGRLGGRAPSFKRCPPFEVFSIPPVKWLRGRCGR